MSKKELITQDNALINASYSLDLIEKRLILLAIARSRQSGCGVSSDSFLDIHADDYAKCFNVTRQASYIALKSASENLFDRYFSFETLSSKGNVEVNRSRWTSHIKYIESESTVRIIFAPAVIPFITELERRFTSYFLEDVSELTSVYAVRLYELIIAWKSKRRTPVFNLEEFRVKLGVESYQYPRMYDFKRHVLDIAIKQINELTNINIVCEQQKKGRSISGFSFSFVEIDTEKDTKTVDWIEEKPKGREKITKQEAVLMARPGEEWPELLARLGKKYHVIGM